MPSDDSPLLTPAQAARALNVSVETIRRWANDGKLRTVRTLGGQRRFSRADVDELIRFQAEAAAS